MSTITLNKHNFKHTIEQSNFVIVLFTADWCEPCKLFETIFNDQSNSNTEIVFGKVNIDDDPLIADYLNIQQVPTVLAIRETIIVDGIHGAMNSIEFMQMIRVWANIRTTEFNRHFSNTGKNNITDATISE
ncbi:thioredoxin domain-containing protein [Methylophilaceae bacterium 11]|jgi:thioredoxin 1|uniref:thioredoxin family protein n=1 Tax=Methylotenera sp. 1P/1 TaxID=1131551 RepID=UPI0003692606|nr:thioredoxin family protein [Methylotenera sp. 1P/1]EUJ10664.1 thioredoxin domain-containing protein [Methylophilaceae bacterium 11]